MPTVEKLKYEREQLLGHWRSVDKYFLRKSAGVVARQFTSMASNSNKGHYIRQFHNVLGYKAGGELAKGGQCLGCLYRTESFIELPQEVRTGKKKHAVGLVKVHLEHTIPVSVLSASISRLGCTHWNEEAIGDFLLNSSIATAMLEEQGRTPNRHPHEGLVLPKYTSHSGVFEENHPHWNRPFMRYTGQKMSPRIFNVLTGVEVDVHTFTMENFHRDLAMLMDESGFR